MKRGLHVMVRGEVQGVGFRYFAQREAERRGLVGWVRNLRDGEVEAYADGEEEAVKEWLSLLYRGPSTARVKEVLPVWSAARDVAEGFEVLPTADRPDPFSS
jgi:acylphosphatase